MRKILVALVLASVPAVAHADQCLVVDAETAKAALRLLQDATVVTYCEPCHDAAPSAPKIKPSISAGKDRIRIDGKDSDLAYTYVQTGKATFTNVGLMIGCGAKGVTPFITPASDPLAAARATVAKLEADEADLHSRTEAALGAYANAQNAADRDAAHTKLDQLRRDKVDLDARLAAAKAAAARAERERGTHVSKECMDNPLAKGC